MTISDSRNKEIAFGRIKRLASSGLPLDAFVRSVFELINDAIPNSPNRVFHVGGNRADAYICNTSELNRVVPLHNQFYVESPPEVSGAKFRINPSALHRLFPAKVIWVHDEVAAPSLYRTEAFNTVLKPWGFHHCLMVMFQEAGEFLGCYPIWRSSDQKPFSAEDARFVRAVAPDISHGLKAAQLLARGGSKPQGEDFWPLPGWGSGVLLVDQDGKLIAWDSVASLVLQQLCVLDGMAAIEFASRSVRDSLRYVVRMVYSIFHEGGASFAAGPPVSQMYFHWSGIVLRLRGVQMVGADGREYVTVLIERGETHESRRRRLIVKWGLTEREFDVLSLLAQGNTGPEISITLGITHDTTRKHASSIFEKLGVKNRTAAAAAMIHENN